MHLAVKASEDIRSTKGIKLLLIKGADRNITDKNEQMPIDLSKQFAENQVNVALIQELESLLVSLKCLLLTLVSRKIKVVLWGTALC